MVSCIIIDHSLSFLFTLIIIRVKVMKQMLIVILLFVYFSPPSLAKQDNERSCFVIGNPEFNQAKHKPGSHKNPYNSLAEVQADDSCKVIHVLYSDTALDGGIWLRDGQKLLGKEGKHGELPIITNTTEPALIPGYPYFVEGGEYDYWVHQSLSGPVGIGIILAKDNEIKNIHIEKTQSTSIIGTPHFQPFGGEIKLNNVLITEANQFGLFAIWDPVSTPSSSVLLASGEDIDITIQNSDIGQSNVPSIIIFTNDSSHGEVTIKNTLVHDQAQLSPYYETSAGISIIATGSSSINASIKNVKVDNIGSNSISNSDGLILLNSGNGYMTAEVDGYHYTNPDEGGHSGTSCGIELGYWDPMGGGTFSAVVKSSIIEGAYRAGIQVLDGNSNGLNTGSNTLDVTLIDNEISGVVGYGIEAFAVDTPNSSLSLTMQNNTISDIGYIGIDIGARGDLDSFEVLLENNTVENAVTSLRFLNYGSIINNLQLDAGLGGLGSAGMNRFVNSTKYDAFIYGMPVSAKNNWGGSDAGPTSIFEGGFGFIDVEPFLLADPNP